MKQQIKAKKMTWYELTLLGINREMIKKILFIKSGILFISIDFVN